MKNAPLNRLWLNRWWLKFYYRQENNSIVYFPRSGGPGLSWIHSFFFCMWLNTNLSLVDLTCMAIFVYITTYFHTFVTFSPKRAVKVNISLFIWLDFNTALWDFLETCNEEEEHDAGTLYCSLNRYQWGLDWLVKVSLFFVKVKVKCLCAHCTPVMRALIPDAAE